MPLQPRPDGELAVVCGASRSGKTVWTARQVERDRRVLVWDKMGEWADRYGCRRISTFEALRAAVLPAAPPERLAFKCAFMTRTAFETFCRYAWVWVRVARGALVIEELAQVTSPGKAPPAWHEIVSSGLRYGPRIFALTQRPAESDKTCMGNATLLHCHQLVRADDERYMARELKCEERQVQELRPLEFLERDRRTGRLVKGRVTFGRPSRRPA